MSELDMGTLGNTRKIYDKENVKINNFVLDIVCHIGNLFWDRYMLHSFIVVVVKYNSIL